MRYWHDELSVFEQTNSKACKDSHFGIIMGKGAVVKASHLECSIEPFRRGTEVQQWRGVVVNGIFLVGAKEGKASSPLQSSKIISVRHDPYSFEFEFSKIAFHSRLYN